MTKEEILFPLHQHCPEEIERVYSHENAVQAMDAYARQEAIEFQNWIDKSEIVYEDIAKCYVKEDAFFCDTVDQLYDLYLTYKNKNNG